MAFEFDEAKSAANKLKHGLDFFEAQTLWQDVDAVELPARSEVEARRLLIAKKEGKAWVAVFTEREGRIRIISVRPARTNEEAIYEQTEDDRTES
ncbi:MAG: BrnT family toxin [Verrucomicrobiia bacterium]